MSWSHMKALLGFFILSIHLPAFGFERVVVREIPRVADFVFRESFNGRIIKQVEILPGDLGLRVYCNIWDQNPASVELGMRIIPGKVRFLQIPRNPTGDEYELEIGPQLKRSGIRSLPGFFGRLYAIVGNDFVEYINQWESSSYFAPEFAKLGPRATITEIDRDIRQDEDGSSPTVWLIEDPKRKRKYEKTLVLPYKRRPVLFNGRLEFEGTAYLYKFDGTLLRTKDFKSVEEGKFLRKRDLPPPPVPPWVDPDEPESANDISGAGNKNAFQLLQFPTPPKWTNKDYETATLENEIRKHSASESELSEMTKRLKELEKKPCKILLHAPLATDETQGKP